MTLGVLVSQLGKPSETFVSRHVRSLAPGRTVAISKQPPRMTFAGVPVVQLPPNDDRFRLRRAVEALQRGPGALRELPPATRAQRVAFGDALLEHGVRSLLVEYLDQWLSFFSAVPPDVRTVVHAHGYDASRGLQRGYWRRQYARWRDADAIIVPSRHMRAALLDAVPALVDTRVEVIPYGTNVADVPRPTTQRDGPVAFLAVGRLVPKKSPLVTLQAFRETLQHAPGVTLDVIGDGPLSDDLAAFVQDHGLAESVRLHGAIPHEAVLQTMASCDVFVQHSVVDPRTGDKEGLPVAIIEAMANGLAVVSTRHAGIPEAVEHGTTGLLVDEGDVAAMGAAMRSLADDPDAAAQMGYAGWQRARERFRVEDNLDRLRAVLFEEP